MSNEHLIMDRTLALSRVGGDEDLLREIAELFLDDYPTLLEGIRQAVADEDASGLERASHSLKGSVANFGAESVYRAALELERIGRSKDLSGVNEAFRILEESLGSLHPMLEAIARTHGGSR